MAVGVDHVPVVGHDGDMALPEDEVAAPEAGKARSGLERLADRSRLHVGIAQHVGAGHVHGKLDEA